MKSYAVLRAPFLLLTILVACGGSTADPLLGSAPDSGAAAADPQGSGNGGGPDCTTVKCGACPTGERHVPPAKAGSCCACEPIPPGQCLGEALPCDRYPCEVAFKPKGIASVDGPGCCSSCEPDLNHCTTQRNNFATWFKNQVAQPGVLDCQVKEDCVSINPSNRCQASCGMAVNKKRAGLQAEAKQTAERDCRNCEQPSIGCPAVYLTPRCNLTTNKCELGLGD